MRVSASTLKQRDSRRDRGGAPAAPRSSAARPFLKEFARQRYLLVLVLPAVLWMLDLQLRPHGRSGHCLPGVRSIPGSDQRDSRRVPGWDSRTSMRPSRTGTSSTHSGTPIAYSLLRLAFGFPIPIVFAVLLNELQNLRFKKFVQTVSYLPQFISWVFVSGFIYVILATDDGIVNRMLLQLGIVQKPILFLASETYGSSSHGREQRLEDLRVEFDHLHRRHHRRRSDPVRGRGDGRCAAVDADLAHHPPLDQVHDRRAPDLQRGRA